MSPPIDLVALLELEQLDDDRYQGTNPLSGPERLFGGQVLAQALRAAAHSVVESKAPHSLHSYFIRAGRLEEPITYEVVRTRDGRAFSTRQVTAIQDAKAILICSASFHVAEDGVDWQVPAPDQGEVIDYPLVEFGHASWSGFEIRSHGPSYPGRFPVAQPIWVRTRQRLPDDPLVHACLLASVSDVAVAPSSRGPYEGPPFAGASLDHALWLHRPCRVDEWLAMHTAAITNASSLGLATGAIHSLDGTRVATVAQEALLRSLT